MRDLTEVLQNYDINGSVKTTTDGPLLKIIAFEPKAGTKLKNVLTVEEDIRRELGVSSLRIEPSQNDNTLLFEVPAEEFETVDFIPLLNSEEFNLARKKQILPLILGKDIAGVPVIADLAKMPHLLIGGTTGSGKSVGLNTFILSLIAAKSPQEVKFVLIDPKKIEFSIYNNQKYLLSPVITETPDAVALLNHLTREMDHRYELMAEKMVKNLAEYNAAGQGNLPHLVCVIDEFADLMALDKNVEKDVIRLAQKARAAGIHLILATQRPSVDVVTGILKANFPTRLAYKVASSADSRTILDTTGAQNLIGRGDSLFLSANGTLTRLHGAYVQDTDISTLLKPFRADIKPLKLTPEKNNLSTPRDKPQKPLYKRLFDFWHNLRQKDRKLIIQFSKYAFTFLAGFFNNRKK